ncbi:MAG: 2-amino-4-hydroxy-6-hydroxymethyldihydropteridine diphosphokinase [Deltaproteobacteria bacterium]|nr:2-amino-4-hydroxy-6-hydroxymethyldihydropteridine diphosphokinase [Deltaproteobacteria bacterium]
MAEPAHLAYIGVGSNLGDRLRLCQDALLALDRVPGCRVVGRSAWYLTEPVGTPCPYWFVNGAVAVETLLGPRALLRRLQGIEAAFRRMPAERWGPRSLDLDLLLYDDLILEDRTLVLPHPRLHERRFVLLPLAELCPDRVHPGRRETVKALLAALPEGPAVLRIW